MSPSIPLLCYHCLPGCGGSAFLEHQQPSKMLPSLSDPSCPCSSLHGPVLSSLWVRGILHLSTTLQISAAATALPLHVRILILAYVLILAPFLTPSLCNVQMASSFTVMQIWFLPYCRNFDFFFNGILSTSKTKTSNELETNSSCNPLCDNLLKSIFCAAWLLSTGSVRRESAGY